jgi:hypothetical protein
MLAEKMLDLALRLRRLQMEDDILKLSAKSYRTLLNISIELEVLAEDERLHQAGLRR